MDFRTNSPSLPNDAFEPPSDERATALLSQLSRKRRAAAIIVPTDDIRVRARLRELGEPQTCFGEGPSERRDRLREYLTRIEEQSEDAADGGQGMDGVVFQNGADAGDAEMADAGGDAQEEFYTAGGDALLAARQAIARYSLPRAKRKIAYQKLEATIPLRTHVRHRNEIKDRLRGFELAGSQVAAERPVSITRFSPNGEMVASGNWSGSVKLLGVPNLETIRTYRGHKERVGGIAWYPGATLPSSTVSPSSVNLASSGQEGNIQLWSLDSDTPLSTLSGHSSRVARLDFHASGTYLASASYDTTWRLWDIPTSTELLLQEGHSREVYTVSFDPSGALLASAGLDSIGRVWDLRTGRTIMLLEGHTREIYGVSWAPDGNRVLTGSADGLAICWDVRMVREMARVPAHSRGVTDLRWFQGCDGPFDESFGKGLTNGGLNGTGKQHGSSGDAPSFARDEKGDLVPRKSGSFFVSCGFDKNVSVISADDWAPLRTLSGHSGNVLTTDVTRDGKWIVSGGHDNTVKLWGRDDGLGV